MQSLACYHPDVLSAYRALIRPDLERAYAVQGTQGTQAVSARNTRVVQHAGRAEYLLVDEDDQVVSRHRTLLEATAAATLRDVAGPEPAPEPAPDTTKRGRKGSSR